MKVQNGKRYILVIFITLSTVLSSGMTSATVTAQGQDVFLPNISSGKTQANTETAEPTQFPEIQSEIEPKQEQVEIPEEKLDFVEDITDLDALGSVSDDAVYQNGDGPWAVPPAGMFDQIESAAVNAFNANNWYVQNKLGVGTDSPAHRIEINENVNWVNRLLIRNNHGGNDASSDVYLTTGTSKGLMIQKFGAGFNQYNWSGIPLADYARIRTDTGVKGLIQTTGSGPMIFGTGDTERFRLHANGGMTIRNTNGNFGIKIEEAQDIGLLVQDGGGDGVVVTNSGSDGVIVSNPTNTGVAVSSAGTYGVYVNNPDVDGVRVFYAGEDGISIANPGEDGISIANPGEDGIDVFFATYTGKNGVHVTNGNIRINNGSFIDGGTTLNVPDYVFEETYPLMTLDEVRAFIEKEKHLPNVPSEDEIHANGLNMSEFHMRLLEKVEELTLYTLQQQEVIESQRVEQDAYRAEIDALKERLSALEEQN